MSQRDFASDSKTTIFGDDNIFEINDFTVVTPFEVFVLSLENAMQELKTEAKEDAKDRDGQIEIQTSTEDLSNELHRTLDYNNYAYRLEYVKQKQCVPSKQDSDSADTYDYLCDAALSLIRTESDFFEKSVIAKQYGITTDFYLIFPIGDNNYMTESTVNMVISAVNTAAFSSECDEIPVLLQFAEGGIVGFFQNRNFSISFEGGVLKRCLSRQTYLDGVVEMFKQKNAAPPGSSPKTRISLQLDFQRKFFSSDDSFAVDSPVREECTHGYPFQLVDSKLLSELRMSPIWVDVDEHYLAESENFSNIDVQSAHKWKSSFKFDEAYTCEQSYLFTRLLEIAEEDLSDFTVKSQIPNEVETGNSIGASAFGSLANKPAFGGLVPKIDILGEDKTSDCNLSYCVSRIMVNASEELDGKHFLEYQQRLLKSLSHAKSAPINSLTRRLASCMLSKVDGQFPEFCRLWHKFLEILRHHWEYNLDLPGFTEEERPELMHCLLHQKLQMLQHCISVKRRKHHDLEATQTNIGRGEQPSSSAPLVDAQSSPAGSTSTGKDDEFYDANESFVEAEESAALEESRGRSHPFDPPEFLKNYPSEQIYVPITQDEGPMTEDQIDKRESFLVSLEDSELRTRAQTELLFSDMQAFKAANPGCVLEDFLRWHSPRDFSDGKLSERMKISGNLWQENWNSARPVPASQQTRLFNETREVEQIFQSLSNILVRDLIALLLPVVSVHMAEILLRNSGCCFRLVESELESLCGQLRMATRTGDSEVYYDVSCSLRQIEKTLMKYSAVADLLQKQDGTDPIALDAFVSEICRLNPVDELSPKSAEVSVPVPDAPDGPIFNALKCLMVDKDGEQIDWSEPERKQTIMRRMAPNPGTGSRSMPQRMYTSHRKGEFVFCGSFTSDAIYT